MYIPAHNRLVIDYMYSLLYVAIIFTVGSLQEERGCQENPVELP